MLQRIRKWIYERRARRCEREGHARIVVERAGRADGLCVIEQRLECARCQLPLSDWLIVLSEASVEPLWRQS